VTPEFIRRVELRPGAYFETADGIDDVKTVFDTAAKIAPPKY
tara:strand:+ start:898 stop:1023 length:126 start_codon:yes stop_codon:yes gene_type:complete